MRVISTEDVNLLTDREGTVSGRIAIDIWVDRKDDLGREYHVMTRDRIIVDYSLETQSEKEIRNRTGAIQSKEYIYTYEEYDAQKLQLEEMFPTELTGSEKDDYLLQSGLLVNLAQVPVYGLIGNVGEKWLRA